MSTDISSPTADLQSNLATVFCGPYTTSGFAFLVAFHCIFNAPDETIVVFSTPFSDISSSCRGFIGTLDFVAGLQHAFFPTLFCLSFSFALSLVRCPSCLRSSSSLHLFVGPVLVLENGRQLTAVFVAFFLCEESALMRFFHLILGFASSLTHHQLGMLFELPAQLCFLLCIFMILSMPFVHHALIVRFCLCLCVECDVQVLQVPLLLLS